MHNKIKRYQKQYAASAIQQSIEFWQVLYKARYRCGRRNQMPVQYQYYDEYENGYCGYKTKYKSISHN
jgi:hypothetical protein